MRRRDLILAASFALSLGCNWAVAASPQASGEHPGLSQARHFGSRHHGHGHPDRHYVPSYLDRPVYYAPAPVFVFPSFLGYD